MFASGILSLGIGQTTTPYFRKTSLLHTSIDIILSNNFNSPSVGIQILHDELSVSYGSILSSCFRMEVAADTVQPLGPQLVSHGIPNIDILD